VGREHKILLAALWLGCYCAEIQFKAVARRQLLSPNYDPGRRNPRCSLHVDTSASRKYPSFAEGLVNGSYRPCPSEGAYCSRGHTRTTDPEDAAQLVNRIQHLVPAPDGGHDFVGIGRPIGGL
jgi:hypothetical protein